MIPDDLKEGGSRGLKRVSKERGVRSQRDKLWRVKDVNVNNVYVITHLSLPVMAKKLELDSVTKKRDLKMRTTI